MIREYLRVIPTSAELNPDVIFSALANLHKLSINEPDSLFTRLNPFRGDQPVTLEFGVISEAKDEPIESNHGSDGSLDVFKIGCELSPRIRSISTAPTSIS